MYTFEGFFSDGQFFPLIKQCCGWVPLNPNNWKSCGSHIQIFHLFWNLPGLRDFYLEKLFRITREVHSWFDFPRADVGAARSDTMPPSILVWRGKEKRRCTHLPAARDKYTIDHEQSVSKVERPHRERKTTASFLLHWNGDINSSQ